MELFCASEYCDILGEISNWSRKDYNYILKDAVLINLLFYYEVYLKGNKQFKTKHFIYLLLIFNKINLKFRSFHITPYNETVLFEMLTCEVQTLFAVLLLKKISTKLKRIWNAKLSFYKTTFKLVIVQVIYTVYFNQKSFHRLTLTFRKSYSMIKPWIKLSQNGLW